MKKINTIISWAILCVSLIMSVNAETLTPIPVPVIPNILPMIESQDRLREYALESVTHGSRHVNADSMDWNYSERFTSSNEVVGDGAEDVLNKLFNVVFRYRLTNPTDMVRGYIYLYDAQDQLVFAGSAEYLVGQQAQYVIWMQAVSILHSVESAEVLALEKDGTTARRYQLRIEYGSVIFQPWMAGAENGLLAVKFTDGSLATYRLNNPQVDMPDSTTDGKSSWNIVGHYVYAPAGGNPKVIKIIETWNMPTAYIEVLAGEVITFDVTGIVQKGGVSFERPLGFTATQQDGPWTFSGPLNFTTGLPQFRLPFAGKYRIRFNWENYGQTVYLYTGPEDDDGGGKG
jgi:hypothetical protein